MKLAKSLLLGSAAGLMAVAGANAADLPVRAAAPAVDYVRVCSAYGNGFFFIPGTDTCLRVGGSVRAQVTMSSQLSRASANAARRVGRDHSTFSSGGSRAQVFFDTRTATEMGLLRSFTRVEYAIDAGVAGGAANLRDAYIQWGGLTAGRTSFSFFQRYNTATMQGRSATIDAFGHGLNVLAYTATFGGGFQATIALEDNPKTRAGITGLARSATTFELNPTDAADPIRGVTVGAYGGTRMPDVVGRMVYSGGWGSIQVGGVVKHIYSGEAAALQNVRVDRYGWALNAQANIKLPMLAPGSEMWLGGTYGEGAVTYTGSAGNFVMRDFTISAADAYVTTRVNARTGLTKSWSIETGLRHNWTSQFQSNIHAAYGKVDTPVQGGRDFTWFNVGKNVAWLPVSGLAFLAEVDYKSVTRARLAVADKRTSDIWAARLRIQRDF